MAMRSSIARCIYQRIGTDDPDRLESHVTCATDTGFATKPKLATRNDRTRDSRVCAVQVGCYRYGLRCRRCRTATTHAGKGYVLGVSSTHVFNSWGKRRSVSGTAADIASTRRSSDWKRLSAGDGTKGPRLHDWCYLELADLDAGQFNSAIDGL